MNAELPCQTSVTRLSNKAQQPQRWAVSPVFGGMSVVYCKLCEFAGIVLGERKLPSGSEVTP
jgi:hypothetical protein